MVALQPEHFLPISMTRIDFNPMERCTVRLKVISSGHGLDIENYPTYYLDIPKLYVQFIFMAADAPYSPYDSNSRACDYRACPSYNWNTTKS